MCVCVCLRNLIVGSGVCSSEVRPEAEASFPETVIHMGLLFCWWVDIWMNFLSSHILANLQEKKKQGSVTIKIIIKQADKKINYDDLYW